MGNKNNCIFCKRIEADLSVYPKGSSHDGICFDCAIRALKTLVDNRMTTDLSSINSEIEGLLLHQAVFDLNEDDHERLSVLREKVQEYKNGVKRKVTMQLFD